MFFSVDAIFVIKKNDFVAIVMINRSCSCFLVFFFSRRTFYCVASVVWKSQNIQWCAHFFLCLSLQSYGSCLNETQLLLLLLLWLSSSSFQAIKVNTPNRWQTIWRRRKKLSMRRIEITSKFCCAKCVWINGNNIVQCMSIDIWTTLFVVALKHFSRVLNAIKVVFHVCQEEEDVSRNFPNFKYISSFSAAWSLTNVNACVYVCERDSGVWLRRTMYKRDGN